MTPQTPSKREWIIEAVFTPEGEITISEQLAYRLDRLAVVLEDIGGVIAVGTDREEISPGVFQTVRAVVRWESFSPARRLPKPQAEPEPPDEPEEEPEAEGDPEEAEAVVATG